MTSLLWRLQSRFLPLLLLASFSSIIVPAAASVTYTYVGNQLTQNDIPPGPTDQHIIASVVFDDAVKSFTGYVNTTSIQAWTIAISAHAATELNSVANAIHDPWPLWFHFENGRILEWQLLAGPSVGQMYPELYTTHNSPYASINPTADFYIPNSSGAGDAYNLNNAGAWTVQSAVPELGSNALFLLGIIAILSRTKISSLISGRNASRGKFLRFRT